MEHLSGQQLLQQAAKLIAENNLDEAVKIFSILVEKLPDAHLPLLSRCTCLIQLERYEEAKIDAEKILALPNIPISDDIAPGNTTLHSVGYARLAKCYKELGQIEEAEKLIKKRQELEKKVVTRKDIENMNVNSSIDSNDDDDKIISEKSAEKLRLQGNELYKKQKYNESLEKYMKAFEIDPNDLLVNSNCAQAYLKLGKLDEALIHAETCIRIDSKFAKGYYRKGCVLLEKKNFVESISAFQLAKRYGAAKESDLEKKIEFANKQIKQQSKNVSNDTFRIFLSRFRLSSFTITALVVVLISIIAWFFFDISVFNYFKDFFYWLLNSYFGDIW
ncbi:28817_t:CDS:2 [Dentiscutata erythropus]|uniref:28817_t:CDS:1 n=1 Tax=Dentiscutata erythropus TaxID=1348616 RepID=A0A9N8VJ11_9GLOM|nr:28817_t:CDS:2 [Dentiscutata erythropus]